MLGHQAEARRDAVLYFQPRDVLAGKSHAAGQRQDPHDGVQQCGLAGAVGADDGDDLVVGDLERHRAHGLDLAIGDVGVGHFQQRAHATAPR